MDIDNPDIVEQGYEHYFCDVCASLTADCKCRWCGGRTRPVGGVQLFFTELFQLNKDNKKDE